MAAGDQYFEDLLKIEITYTGERNTAANILYASCLGAHGATLSDLNALAETIGNAWATDIMPYVSASVTCEDCFVSDWTDSDGLTGAHLQAEAGSLSGGKLPSQVCVLVNEETLTRFRGGHGRIYLPQPDTTKLTTDQTWDGTFVNEVTDAIVGVLDAINGASIGDDLLTAVLYHRDGNKVVEQGFEEIVAATANAVPGTQRRRVRRVGHLA